MKNIIFFIFLFLIPTIVYSQNEKRVDSLLVVLGNNEDYITQINTLNNICLEYNDNDHAKLKLYNQKILELSKKYNYDVGLGLYYLNSSRINSKSNNATESLKFSKKAAAIFKKNKNTGNYLNAIIKVSSDYIAVDSAKEGKSILKENLKLALKYKDNDIWRKNWVSKS